jgi:hypothetical protein
VDTKALQTIARAIRRISGPAIPPLTRPIGHGGLGLRLESGDLPVQLLGEPHVIGVQQGNVLAGCVADPEVA